MASRILATAFLLLFAFTSAIEVAAVDNSELDSMLNALRDRGYNLLSNAIATSDLVLEILSGKSFTFLVPTDSSNTASDYIATHRCHIIPSRISVADLGSFPSEIYFPTLFKSHLATIRIHRLPLIAVFDNFITFDRVGVNFPGLFYSLNIAVHGSGEIVNCNSHQGSPREWRYVPLDTSGHDGAPSSENILNGKASSPSLGNLYDDHSFSSPVVSQNQLLSPSTTSREIPNNGIESPEREQINVGSAPANSRELLLSQISPAWSEILTPAVTFVPTTEPPVAPEFSENDDRMYYPPSNMMTIDKRI